MKSIFLILLLSSILFTAPGCSSEYTENAITGIAEKILPLDLIKVVIPFLNDVTSSWNYSVLEKYIEASDYSENIEHYKLIFNKHSHLGKFKTCKNMESVEIDQLEVLVRILKGNCNFENGNAFVQIVFKSEDSNNELVGFLIKEVWGVK